MRLRTTLPAGGRHVVVFPFALAVLLTAIATPVGAQGLTYVDADDGFFSGSPNLRAAEAGLSLADVLDSSQSLNDDNKWGWRNFASDATIFTSANGDSGDGYENAPEIVQTISSGLTPGMSYDIYVAYWSGETFSWGVRAGLSSNPGNNQYFNRNGNFAGGPPAIAGILASSLAWDVLPPDNPDPSTNDDQGVFREGPRDMLLGLVGTAVATGGSIDVYIDDLSPGEFGVGSFHRAWFDGVAWVEAGAVLAPVLTIDRQSGNVTLTNNTNNNVTVAGYSINSGAGGLDPANWMRVNDDDTWNIINQTANELSEEEAPGGDGGALLAANGGEFDFGNVWIPTPFEDVAISLTLDDMSVTSPIIEYTGDAIPFGDFTGDAMITLDDYQVLLDNLQSDYTSMTTLEAYLLGDINGDLVVNLVDFLDFRAAYEGFNGLGSFAADVGAVPEPHAALIISTSLLLLFARRGAVKHCNR